MIKQRDTTKASVAKIAPLVFQMAPTRPDVQLARQIKATSTVLSNASTARLSPTPVAPPRPAAAAASPITSGTASQGAVNATGPWDTSVAQSTPASNAKTCPIPPKQWSPTAAPARAATGGTRTITPANAIQALHRSSRTKISASTARKCQAQPD